MEIVLATAGCVLLLLAVGGGIKGLKTKVVEKAEFVPAGDRAFAGLIGISLISTAVALSVTKPEQLLPLWASLASGVLFTILYAAFLWWTDSKTRNSSGNPDQTPSSSAS